MNTEFSIDDMGDDVDETIADSRVVKVIDEMECVEDHFIGYDETEIQRELTEMF